MLRMTPLALALAMAWGLSPAMSAAQTPPEREDQEATRLNEVTVSSTRTQRRVDDVPNSVTVLTARQIEEAGARDIKDVFRNEIDVTVRAQPARFTAASSATGRAGNDSINVRGLEGNQVLLMVDGIRVPNTFTFGPFATGRGDYLEVDGIKTVEVLRGPASTQYGSDGLAGAVSLRTLDPSDLLKPGQTSGGFLRVGYASVDKSWNNSAGFAGKNGQWQAMLLASAKQGHEIANKGDNASLDTTRTAPNPQDTSNRYLLGKALLALDATHQLGVTAEMQRRWQDTEVYSARAVPPLGATSTLDLDAHDRMERDRLALEYRFNDLNAAGMQKAEARVYVQDARVNQFTTEDRNTAADRTRDNTYRARTLGLSSLLESNLTGWANQRLTYGLDWSRAEIAGVRDGTVPPANETFPTKPFPDTSYTLTGAFVQSEIEAGPVSVIPALRFDHYQLSPSQAGYSAATVAPLADQAFTPRLGVVWRLNPSFAPYAQWAKGFRAPTPEQVNNGFSNPTSGYMSIGNPNLKAERADSVEIGFRGTSGQVRYSAAIYDNRYADFISQETVGGAGTQADPTIFQYINLANARIRGVEVRTAWALRQGWSANAGLAYAEGDSEKNGTRTPIDTIQPLKAVAGLRYDRPDWGLRATVLYAKGKEAERIATPASQPFAPPTATVLDLGAHWKLARNITLNANLNNVFDTKYWRWSDVRGLSDTSPVKDGYTAPGRNAQVSVRLDF